MSNRYGWSSYNDGSDDVEGRLSADDQAAIADDVRAIGIGAICDLDTKASQSGSSQSFAIQEYVELDSGQRVIVDERGFTLSSVRELVQFEDGRQVIRENVAPANTGLTPDSIRQTVLNVVLPDDDESGDEHPWRWLAEQSRKRGIDVIADDLRGLDYRVTLTSRLVEWLEGSRPDSTPGGSLAGL